MTLPLFSSQFEIDNLCHASTEKVSQLREILSRPALETGVHIVADEKRPDFFDLHAFGRVFFIHVVPMRHKIHLLAVWKAPAARRVPIHWCSEESWGDSAPSAT